MTNKEKKLAAQLINKWSPTMLKFSKINKTNVIPDYEIYDFLVTQIVELVPKLESKKIKNQDSYIYMLIKKASKNPLKKYLTEKNNFEKFVKSRPYKYLSTYDTTRLIDVLDSIKKYDLRGVGHMRFVLGMSMREISKETGFSIGTVHSIIKNISKKIMKLYIE